MTRMEEVKKLAALARIQLTDAEVEAFSKEFDSILAYVGQLDSLEVGKGVPEAPRLRNVMREDGEPHAAGAFTQMLAEEFPKRDGDYLEVKQIISYD